MPTATSARISARVQMSARRWPIGRGHISADEDEIGLMAPVIFWSSSVAALTAMGSRLPVHLGLVPQSVTFGAPS
jgi:hypothetical protein